MKKYKTYEFRIYPNKSQTDLIQRTFGCCRFVYNHILALQKENYESGSSYLSKTNANNYCNRVLKEEFPFLRDVDKFALTNAIWNLDSAFQGFFKKRTGFPHYKCKKHSRKSYRTNYSNGNIAILDHAIKLPKLKEVKAKVHRAIPQEGKVKSATVFQTKSGKYYCAVLFEIDVPEVHRTLETKKAIGLDYKSDGLYAASDGTVCGSPKYYRACQKRLDRELKKLSRKQYGSKNYEKQRVRVAKMYQHVSNQRKDFLHKESRKLSNKHDIVVVENLNLVKLSSSGLRNGKATLDNGWGLFVYYLSYKLQEQGKELIKVDKFFPSSQLCTLCGSQNKAVRNLSVREWECPVCHSIHNRDINAAENIRREGVRMFAESNPEAA